MNGKSPSSAAALLVDVPLSTQNADADPGPSSSVEPFEIESGHAPLGENGNGNGKAAHRIGDKESLVSINDESSYKYEGPASSSVNPHEVEPTGTWYHAAFHTVTAVVGAGVLGLPYSVRWLGWVAGMLYLGLACAVSYYTSYQLAELHHYQGNRHNRYRDLGRAILGPKLGLWLTVPFQFSVMIGLGITYTVTAGQSFKGIADDLCYGTYAECQAGVTSYIFIFGGIQILLSQLPSFHDLSWVSLLGAAMSIGYCTIAAFASIFAAGSEEPYVETVNYTSADKVFNVMNALGSITFAYGGHSVLLEIQATLKDPPRAARSMMVGITIAYVIVVISYFFVAASGYAAFGNGVNPDVLLSVSNPKWLIDVANAMVIVHVAAGYQIFTMPIYEAWEVWMVRKQFRVAQKPWLMRLIFRTAYVLATTCVAALLPFFSDLMGLIGATGFLPCTFILPCVFWLMARDCNIVEIIINWAIIITFVIVACVSLVGSMRNIIVHVGEYHIWD